jgi:hypothetical protein
MKEGARIAVLRFFGVFIFGLLLMGLAYLIQFLLGVHMDWAFPYLDHLVRS